MKIFLFNELHGLALGGKKYMGAEVLRCQIIFFLVKYDGKQSNIVRKAVYFV